MRIVEMLAKRINKKVKMADQKSVNQMVEEYNVTERVQAEKLLDIFKAVKNNKGPRRIKLGNGDLLSEFDFEDDARNYFIRLHKFDNEIVEIVPGIK